MEPALFTVRLADLDYGEREIDEEIPVSWLARALEGTEAVPRERPGRLSVVVSRSGRDVMVRGRARATVTLPCARTLDPVDFDLDPEIFLLLAKAPAAPAAALKDHGKKAPRKGERPARRPREEPADEGEAARDTFEGETVALDGFVREFLLLELPMVPLREDLRSETTPGIERPPEVSGEGQPAREAIDPRLAPLAAIASRLRAKKE